MAKNISILGSTGSIGTSTLDVIRLNRDKFNVTALSAGTNIELLKTQITEFEPELVSVSSDASTEDIKDLESFCKNFTGKDSNTKCDLAIGDDGASLVASFESADLVVAAIVGAAGLKPTLSAIRAGKDVALANKESLVVAGSLVMSEAHSHGVAIIPVDSEHSAIMQSLVGHRAQDVTKIILTASGGPFLRLSLDDLKTVTAEEALKHPNWDMGKKVTIDSSTLMNKGFEVIEAMWLFDMPRSKVDVTIHPQSIVHSMVEYIDGSIVAQLGSHDMRGAISYAIGFPERVVSGAKPFSITDKNLEFLEVDRIKFPCLDLAFSAMNEGGTMPAVLNAADEVAVEKFLNGEITYLDISTVIEEVMSRHSGSNKSDIGTLEDIMAVDKWARGEALSLVKTFT